MKVYSISRLAFWGICLLILTLPVSRHWKLLSSGERCEGIVGTYVLISRKMFDDDRQLVQANEIRFQTGDSIVLTYGPHDFEYEEGRVVKVIYEANDPAHNFEVTFAKFYLTNYTVLIVIMMILWLAFYHSFNNYRKKQSGKTSVPASSPYRTTQRRRPQSLNKKLGR